MYSLGTKLVISASGFIPYRDRLVISLRHECSIHKTHSSRMDWPGSGGGEMKISRQPPPFRKIFLSLRCSYQSRWFIFSLHLSLLSPIIFCILLQFSSYPILRFRFLESAN
ncbi:hypothetical protein ASPZODRAFT_1533578 [Penicilliopsis zonata CBS 506.65]|uniref:Uncharacterized protein n=1 Tax=Penicilliopsis zonata CBS 506.65 TaxID=1073090 RepID=A0A1L9SM45_9EURO|nr:hypothetical protein ASPZODRAFT_1533578 [Penicilliopsis zonata CBS 506.65]OJJ48171.1 hypothetical protein ASPZODRAFT_1533578 [Penicilliopsis zonata CBS 506.65]